MPTPIQDLQPDFVIEVNANDNVHKEAMKNLISTLESKGFHTKVRGGAIPKSVLIFVKISGYKFAEEHEKDLMRNYEFGLTAKNDLYADKLRIISNLLESPESAGGLGITPKSGKWKNVLNIMPITPALQNTTISQDIKSSFSFSSSISKVKHIYGVQVAIYFEFLKAYTAYLSFLSVFGLVSYLKHKKTFSLTYTVVNLFLGTLFGSLWNKRQSYLVNFWGVQNSHLIDQENIKLESLNKKFEVESTYKHTNNSDVSRYIKQIAFLPIALCFALGLLAYQLVCFFIEIFISDIYSGPGKSILGLLPTIMLSCVTPIISIVYNLVSEAMIKWEGHSSEYTKSNSRLIKGFILTFLTSYSPLVITSFIYLPFVHLIEPNLNSIKHLLQTKISDNIFCKKYILQLKSQDEFTVNQQRLTVQFSYFILTNQIIQLILKYALPLILDWVKQMIARFITKPKIQEVQDEESEKEWLENVRKALSLPEYNVNDDFRGLIQQFGYLIMFGPVSSIAPLVCILFNLLTYRLDLAKLTSTKYFRPSVPTRVDSFFPWDYALFGLTWIGSFMSPLVTLFYRHGHKPPKHMGSLAWDHASINSNLSYSILVALFSEHLFFLFSFLINKLLGLIKTKVEWDNDFADNDVKLRRDVFSQKIRSSLVLEEDGEWDNGNSSTSIDMALKLLHPAVDSSKTLQQKEEELRKFKDKNDSYVEHKTNGDTVVSTIDDNKHFLPPKPLDSETSKISSNNQSEHERDSSSLQELPPSNIEEIAPQAKSENNGLKKRLNVKPEGSTIQASEEKGSSEASSMSSRKKSTLKKFLKKK